MKNHRHRLVKNIGGNQNLGEKVGIIDETIGIFNYLGASSRAAPPCLCLCEEWQNTLSAAGSLEDLPPHFFILLPSRRLMHLAGLYILPVDVWFSYHSYNYASSLCNL